MKEMLEKLRLEALGAIGQAKDLEELDALRVKYLGKRAR